MMRGWHLTWLGIISASIGMFPAPLVAQPGAQPQFSSGGIRVIVNRAARHSSGQQLIMSLVLSNTRDDDAELVVLGNPMVVSDTGGASNSSSISGVPVCAMNEASRCLFYMQEHKNPVPVVIDGNNSVSVTLAFPTSESSKTCAIDFSMIALVRRKGGRSEEPWRQISIGLPNIRVC